MVPRRNKQGKSKKRKGGARKERIEQGKQSNANPQSPPSSVRQAAIRAPAAGLTINLTDCKYELVENCAKSLGFTVTREADQPFDIWFTAKSVVQERVKRLTFSQKINHFPGSMDICLKDKLAINLNKMRDIFPDEYSFYPMTFCLPLEWDSFCRATFSRNNATNKKTWIVKPNGDCRGRGIFLTTSRKDIDPKEGQVVQEYLPEPLLIDGQKFDLRVYVFIASVAPLRLFLYEDGLVRICTEPYVKPTACNLDNHFMHLTNYSVNKNAENFTENTEAPDAEGGEEFAESEQGHKRSILWLKRWLAEQGHDSVALWQAVADIVVKTFISVAAKLSETYTQCTRRSFQCFEILGFDLMVDSELRPWLLEVNQSPSFNANSVLDKRVKEGVVREALALANMTAERKEDRQGSKRPLGASVSVSAQWDKELGRQQACEEEHAHMYKLIHPLPDAERVAQQSAMRTVTRRARSVIEQQRKQRAKEEAKVEAEAEAEAEVSQTGLATDAICTVIEGLIEALETEADRENAEVEAVAVAAAASVFAYEATMMIDILMPASKYATDRNSDSPDSLADSEQAKEANVVQENEAQDQKAERQIVSYAQLLQIASRKGPWRSALESRAGSAVKKRLAEARGRDNRGRKRGHMIALRSATAPLPQQPQTASQISLQTLKPRSENSSSIVRENLVVALRTDNALNSPRPASTPT